MIFKVPSNPPVLWLYDLQGPLQSKHPRVLWPSRTLPSQPSYSSMTSKVPSSPNQCTLLSELLCPSAPCSAWLLCRLLAVAAALLVLAVYHAIYLEELTAVELTEKLAQLFSISSQQISQIYKQGPTGIHVLISDEVKIPHCSSFCLSCPTPKARPQGGPLPFAAACKG